MASESQLFQLSTNLNKAKTASEHYSVHKSESERLSNAATYTRQHSGQIDSDLSQEIANYVVKQEGREGAEALFAGKDRARLENHAKDYIHSSGVENNILSAYQQNSSNINPNQKYLASQAEIANKKSGIIAEHVVQAQNLASDIKAKDGTLKEEAKETMFDQQKYEQTRANIEDNHSKFSKEINDERSAQNKEYSKRHAEISNDIKDGIKKSKNSAFNMKDSIKPEYAQDKEGSK